MNVQLIKTESPIGSGLQYSKIDINADYRANEPDWIQVKVGACDEHMNRLNLLDNLITTDNNISTAKIALAKIDVTICPYCGRKLDCEIEIDTDGEIISCGCSHCNDEFFDK